MNTSGISLNKSFFFVASVVEAHEDNQAVRERFAMSPGEFEVVEILINFLQVHFRVLF